MNSAQIALNWEIGRRIHQELLNEKRAAYGEEIVSTVSRQLTEEFGAEFSRPNVFRMTRFAEVFPNADAD